jgi:hypothetical protein
VSHPGPAPRQGTILHGEPTIEGLVKALQEAQPSAGLFTTEGARMVGGHAFKDDAKLRTLGTLCELWDSGETDRVRVGERVHVECRLSLWLMMPPAVFSKFVADGLASDQGFLARVLLAEPESRMGERLAARPGIEPAERERLDEEAEEAIGRWAELVCELILQAAPRCRLFSTWKEEEGTEAHDEPVADEWTPPSRRLTLAPDAAALLVKFHDQAKERELGKGGRYREISGFAEKTTEMATRLAGIFSLIEDTGVREINSETMHQALRVICFFLQGEPACKGRIDCVPAWRSNIVPIS